MPTLTWSFYPLLWLAALGLTAGYAFFLHSSAAARSPRTPLRMVCFGAGVLLLLGVTASPLEALARNYLLTARMAQHLVLIYLIPPLLISGLGAGHPAGLILRFPWLEKALRQLGHPFTAVLIFHLGVVLWYVPAICEFALHQGSIAQLEHLSLLLVGCIMWLPLVNPLPHLRLPFARRMFYLVVLIGCQVPLFGILTLSGRALYATYRFAPRITDLSAYGDQQTAGWLLKLLTVLVFAGGFIAIFLQWHAQQRLQDRDENRQAEENMKLLRRAIARLEGQRPRG